MSLSVENGVFISYRRSSGSSEARIFETYLSSQGFDVFLDVDGLSSGHFDEQLLEQIESRANFILICSPGVFDRCDAPDDWLCLEITRAIAMQRNIVPIELQGFSWPRMEALPPRIAAIGRYNSFRYDHASWKLTCTKLVRMLRGSDSDLGGATRPKQVLRAGESAERGASETPTYPTGDREKLARARGLVAEVKRLGAHGSESRRPALRCLLDRTRDLPVALSARRELACLRVDAALELNDVAVGVVVLKELLDAELQGRPSDRQIQLLAQAEARGWIQSHMPAIGDYFELEVEAPRESELAVDAVDWSEGREILIDSDGCEFGPVFGSSFTDCEQPAVARDVPVAAESLLGRLWARLFRFVAWFRSWLPAWIYMRRPAAAGQPEGGYGLNAGSEEQNDVQWIVHVPGCGQSAPLSAQELQTWLDTGEVTGEEWVWRSDWSEWRAVREVFPDVVP